MADEWINVRIRLQDARKFAADAALDAAAIRGIGAAADTTAGSLGRATNRSFLANQAMYTLRRGAFYATVALAGLGTASVAMGIRFNSTMEQNTISLSHFLGSTQAATRELNTLYTLAAQTPFEFPQLTAAATRFLAFGFSLKEANADLRIIGDTAAGLGAGAEGIERLVLVFGQMRATGRVLGNDLLQLAALGVPAMQILQRELGLTAAQMEKLGQGTLRIPAEVAIPALMRGLQAQFGGLSRLQAQSFQGLVSTAHDYAAQLAGIITHPLFITLERDLRRLNPLLRSLGASFKAGGWTAMIQTLDDGVGAGGRLVAAWQDIRAIGQDLGRLMTGTLVPSFRLLWATLGFGSPAMRLLVGFLGIASRHTTLLNAVLSVLAVRLVLVKIQALRAAWAMKGLSVWSAIGMAAGPFAALGVGGALVLGIAAVAAGLIYLYVRWQAFHNAVNATFVWIRGNWPLLLAILTGPVGVAVYEIVKHFDRIKQWFVDVRNWIAHPFEVVFNLAVKGRGVEVLKWLGFISTGTAPAKLLSLAGSRLGIPHIPGTQHIPGFASGGVMPYGGVAMVGERGPELLRLPAGAAVQPLTAGSPLNLGGALGDRPLHVHLHIDGREVLQSVIRYPRELSDAVFGQTLAQGARA